MYNTNLLQAGTGTVVTGRTMALRLTDIPGWDWKRDDQAVCINEVKFGLLAQSCLASGFFTMASNMMTTSLPGITPEMPRWKKDYLSTSNKVVLAETLSPTFVGFTFQVQKTASYCYIHLFRKLLRSAT